MSCLLGSCEIDPYEVYEATVYDHHYKFPIPLLRVSIPDVGVRNIWHSNDNPPPIGSPIKVRYSRKHGWELEEA